MHDNPSAYLETWSAELQSRAMRVRHLIGDRHWLSDGHHKEALLREFLKRYLPPTIGISRGFIRTLEANHLVSNEIDLLITDPERTPYLFVEGDLVITLPTAVLGHIEVKSKYSRNTFKEAMQSLIRNQNIASLNAGEIKPWSGVFFFASDEPSDYQIEANIAASIVNEGIHSASQGTHDGWETDMEYVSRLMPRCVVVMERFIIFFNALSLERGFQVKLFPIAELSFAYGVSDLFDSIRSSQSGQKTVTELESWLMEQPHDGPYLAKVGLPK